MAEGETVAGATNLDRLRETARDLSRHYKTRPVRIYKTDIGSYWLRFDRKAIEECDGHKIVLVATYLDGEEIDGTNGGRSSQGSGRSSG